MPCSRQKIVICVQYTQSFKEFIKICSNSTTYWLMHGKLSERCSLHVFIKNSIFYNIEQGVGRCPDQLWCSWHSCILGVLAGWEKIPAITEQIASGQFPPQETVTRWQHCLEAGNVSKPVWQRLSSTRLGFQTRLLWWQFLSHTRYGCREREGGCGDLTDVWWTSCTDSYLYPCGVNMVCEGCEWCLNTEITIYYHA